MDVRMNVPRESALGNNGINARNERRQSLVNFAEGNRRQGRK